MSTFTLDANTLGGRTANGTIAQYQAVKAGTATDFVVVAASTDVVLGLLQDDPATGEAGAVQFNGVARGRAGAVIAEGAEVMSAADGDLITFVAAAGNYIIGVALDGAAADGEIFPVLMTRGHGTT